MLFIISFFFFSVIIVEKKSSPKDLRSRARVCVCVSSIENVCLSVGYQFFFLRDHSIEVDRVCRSLWNFASKNVALIASKFCMDICIWFFGNLIDFGDNLTNIVIFALYCSFGQNSCLS